jgi:serine protease Do
MYSPITDAAVSDMAKLKKLQSVRLYGTRISNEAANRLNSALSSPDTTKAPEPEAEGDAFPPGASRRVATIVDRRGGALLGVSGSLGEEGCEINSVTPDSAADKAGVRQGDTIVSFDGKAVKNFTDLTSAISDKAGGDKVKIEIAREGKRSTVEATLGEW